MDLLGPAPLPSLGTRSLAEAQLWNPVAAVESREHLWMSFPMTHLRSANLRPPSPGSLREGPPPARGLLAAVRAPRYSSQKA
ncbi:unnamed protein product [Merluccius merluccius]